MNQGAGHSYNGDDTLAVLGNSETMSWTGYLKNFTKNTSFHGLKYIFEDTPFVLRRFLWIVISLTMFSGFAFLMSFKLLAYHERNAQIDLEQVYLTRAKFPKVTICNQNPHRLTALNKLGMLDVLLQSYDRATNINFGSTSVPKESGCIEYYTVLPEVCEKPGDKDVISEYNQVSIDVCKDLCSTLKSERCSGVFYVRLNNTCIVTSFIGDPELTSSDDLTSSDGAEHTKTMCTGNVLYFRRKRCTDLVSFRCHFEEKCEALTQPDDTKDLWLLVPGRDNTLTLDKGKGHYQLLVDTTLRPRFDARLQTPFMDTTNKCLLVHFRFFGSAKSMLNIVTVKENIEEKIIESVTGNEHLHFHTGKPLQHEHTALWWPLLIQLPAGIHRVVLNGVRARDGSSGIGLDDIEINYCAALGRECKYTVRGQEYLGSVHTTVYGDQCLPWSDPWVSQSLVSRNLSYAYLASATAYTSNTGEDNQANYCRNLDGDLNGPWCLTGGQQTKETCPVDYCQCQAGWFRCKDNRCIPEEWKCNGVADCNTGEDERIMECQARMNITCGFEELFMCGYSFPATGNIMWQRQLVNRDVSQGNFYVMNIVRTENANLGGRTLLMSPSHTFHTSVQVQFDAFLWLKDPEDTISMLEVVLMTTTGLTGHRLWKSNTAQWESFKNWQTYSVCVPAGRHSLGFRYTSALESKAGIDGIKVTEKQCTPMDIETPTGSVNCDFNLNDCNHEQQSDNFFSHWKRLPLDFVHFTHHLGQFGGCSGSFFDIDGVMASYRYPAMYENDLTCSQNIIQPTGSTLTVTFDEFDLEYAEDCEYDVLSITDGIWEQKMCGEGLPSPFESTQNIVSLKFQSDYSISGRGFHLKYSTVTLPETDYVMAASFQGEMNDYEIIHNTLSSPIFNISEDMCLTLDGMFLSQFTLYLKAIDDNRNGQVTSLVRIVLGIGYVWNQLSIDISPNTQGNQMFLLYDSVHAGIDAAYSTFINNVQLEPGRCLDKSRYKSGTVTCNFSSKDQCGYIDVSSGPNRWMRTYSNKLQDFTMRVVFEAEYTTAVLLSPEIKVEEDMCLTFSASVTQGLLMYVTTNRLANRSEPVLTHYSSDSMTRVVPLPEGTYRIMFGCSGQHLGNTAELHNVMVSNQTCQTNGLVREANQAESRISDNSALPVQVMEPDLSHNVSKKHFSDDVLRQEIETFETLVQYYQNSDLREFLSEAVQNKDDFIASCLFEGRKCDPVAWKLEFIDRFVCFSFNHDDDAPYYTNDTGAEHGLRMMLNVEHYENVPGVSKDAGIKVYIGDQDDVPLMRELGIAVAPGTHTLASMTHLAEELLEPPYGNCGKEILDHYYPQRTYTYNRCRTSCSATLISQKCGCDNLDMETPDGSGYCNVDDYLSCLVPDFFSSHAGRCDCVGECSRNHYTTDLSYTSLSLLDPASIVPDNITDLKERFHTALNVRERNVGRRFAKTLRHLDSLLTKVERFQMALKFNFFDARTSYIKLLEKGTKIIIKDLVDDADKFYKNITDLENVYSIYYIPYLDTLFHTLDSVKTNVFRLNEIGLLYNFGCDIIVDTALVEYLIRVSKQEAEFAKNLLQTLNLAEGYVHIGNHSKDLQNEVSSRQKFGKLPSSLFISKKNQNDCIANLKCLDMYLRDIIDDVDVFSYYVEMMELDCANETTPSSNYTIGNETNSAGYNYENVQEQKGENRAPGIRGRVIRHFRNCSGDELQCSQIIEKFKLCVKEYHLYLQSMQQDGAEVNHMLASYKEAELPTIAMTEIDTGINILRTTINQYASGQIDTFQVSRALAENVNVKINAGILGKLLSELKSKVVDASADKIKATKCQLLLHYNDLFSNMVKYNGYIYNTQGLSDLISSMSIWRVPYASIRNKDVRLFRKSESEGRNSIPGRNNGAFINQTGRLQAREYINVYFDDLVSALSSKFAEMSEMVNGIKAEIGELDREMMQFLQDGEIGEKFIRENYLQLDIYFGLLRIDTIKQKMEYDLPTFFSDFGGYMGLLLGGSLVSLVEMMDWLIHSIALRNRTKSREKKQRHTPRRTLFTERDNDMFNVNKEGKEANDIIEQFYPKFGIKPSQLGGLPRFSSLKHFSPKPIEQECTARKLSKDDADHFHFTS